MRILSWCRSNAMLAAAVLAAGVTAFFVPPDGEYLGYFDMKTLCCLFCVLAVVGALRDMNIFAALSQRLVRSFGSVRSVCTALVIITMAASMLLTNDTALLTFLPLGWFVLDCTGQRKHVPLLFVLQNCGANLSGMITPFGNPQNLYLYSYYGIGTGDFVSIMLPPFLISTALILAGCLLFPKTKLSVPDTTVRIEPLRTAAYAALFCLAVAMVLRAVPYAIGAAVTLAVLLVLDRRAIAGLDWKPCPHRGGAYAVCVSPLARGHGGFGADEPAYKQRAGSHSSEPLYRGLRLAARRREHRRNGYAHSLACGAYHLP